MKIAILTSFRDFNQGYSLVNVVSNQAAMLTRFGHEVDVFVDENFSAEKHQVPKHVNIKPLILSGSQTDYQHEGSITEKHVEYSKRLAKTLSGILRGYDICLTHDWIYTGWHLPYFLALEHCKDLTKGIRFYHFINSVPPRFPFSGYEWWDLDRLGKNHTIVSFTETNKSLLSQRFKTNRIVVLPHIVDIRVENDFCDEAWALTNEIPNLLQGDIVCVYPASTDRLRAKQVQVLITLFNSFKLRNLRVCLLIVNQWATGRVPQENIQKYKDLANGFGLRYADEFYFTSDFRSPKYESGLNRKMMSDLYKLSNLFIFPTIEESYGLVGIEAALNGQYIVVNKDVSCFSEIYGPSAHYESFASFEHPDLFKTKSLNEIAEYLDDVAQRIVVAMAADNAVQMRTRMRQQNNMDKMYVMYWEKLINGHQV